MKVKSVPQLAEAQLSLEVQVGFKYQTQILDSYEYHPQVSRDL